MRSAAFVLLAAASVSVTAAPASAATREIALGVESLQFRTGATALNRDDVFGLGDGAGLLRGTVSWRETRGPIKAVLRGLVERSLGFAEDDTELVAREAYLQVAGVAASLRLGKQRVAWGSGFAWNPTIRLEPPKNALNTSLEQEGVWALRGEWTPAANVTATLVGARVETQPGDRAVSESIPARYGAAACLAVLIENVDVALVGSVQEERDGLVGLDLARSVGGRVTAHLEAALYGGSEMPPARTGAFWRVVAGLLYTRGEEAFALEYFHNREGYDDRQRAEWLGALDAAYTASRDVTAPPALRERAFASYVLATNVPDAGLGLSRDYIHASWTRSHVAGEWGLSLRGVASLTDGGVALTPGVSYAPTGRVTMSADGLLPLGPAGSEYRVSPVRGGVITRVKVHF